MESLARFAARRPVAVTVLAVAVVLLGQVAWRRLPIDLLPDVQSPTVLVAVQSGDRPPLEMERLYGEQVEQRLFTVGGIRAIEEVARTGRLVTRVTFDWGVNMDLAVVEVQKALGSVAADPEVDEVVVRRFDPRQLPVLAFGLVAPQGRPDLAELRRMARRQVGPALEQLEGVAQVRVVGGREREVQVRLDRQRMDGFGITLREVESRLQAANLDVNAGTLEEGDRVYLVRGLARFHGPEDVAKVVVRFVRDGKGGKVPVRVADVADVILADADIESLVLVDGREGVGLEVYKEAGANTVRVSRIVREALAHLDADLPGVEVRLAADEAALVEEAIADVEGAALLGIALAVIVLILFLRAAGPTLVVAAAVPVSLLATVVVMGFFGHGLNLMTLGGLALGAGMLVDNAIVVIESISRRRSEGAAPEEAAASGTARVAGAIAASTLTTCVVFLPVLFVRGLAARLVSGLAFTVVFSLLASLAVAVLLIPALARWLLPKRQGRIFDPGKSRVEGLVATLLPRSGLVVALSVLVVALAISKLAGLGTELLPPADPHQMGVRLVGPPGQRVENTATMAEAVEGVIRAVAGDDVDAVVTEVGRVPSDDRFIREERSEENSARLRVRLSREGRSAGEVIRAAAPAVAQLEGIEVEWDAGTSALARALGTGGAPIQVELTGRSLEDLRRGAAIVQAALSAQPELWNARSSFEGGPPELRVVMRRTLADGLGVELDEVAAVLQASLDGRRATVLTMGDEERDVRLFLPRVRSEELPSVPFASASGARVTVGEVARLESVQGAREIFRRDQRRVAQVTARVADGVEYPEALAAAERALSGIELDPGLRAHLAGEEEERERTFAELKWAGILAVVLVLMVLAGSFESLRHPVTVLAAIPLALVGVAVVLVPLGQPIGVMSVLGLIVLAGVAVNDAILLVDTARRLKSEGLERRKALAGAAAIRLRPILMTTATTVLALLPLAIGIGEAAQLRAPLALTLIGGLIFSTIGSIFVIPCVYDVMEELTAGSSGS
ncbi:MAG: efflux RND transporter permease subunit [Thermoanaerobaculales bacterium]|nr:efflux RND transporter permease subunit [Thermoanaerobaculales bacterium]